jgi:hypothetical protein
MSPLGLIPAQLAMVNVKPDIICKNFIFHNLAIDYLG